MASSIRKVSEDVKLRPFLSTHFDSQTYIKTVIKEGRSEECFNNVATCIEEVNEEIKAYISQNKDVLMSGMQDVALLSERYSLLYSTSQKLQRNVDRLKKEALESYDLVKLRTVELERIHTTSMILRQLRQFVHCRAQLEHLLKAAGEVGGIKAASGVNSDIRHLASSAKTLYELEGVLASPALLEIKFVSQHVKSVQEFGRQLRELAKEKLLTALVERNQAYVAASLQVFFNLQSLPEIVLLAVDATIKATVDLSRGTLDLDSLAAAHPDLLTVVTTASMIGRGSVTAAIASAGGLALQPKKPLPTVAAAQQQPNSSALRTAMREIAREWGAMISDQAMQINVLQRVIAKKEDPSTHVKFTSILESVGQGNPALSSNRLIDLFWARLQMSMQDVAAEKLKVQPVASSRIYPYLRKVAVEAVNTLKMLSSRDLNRDALTGFSGGASSNYSGGDGGYGGDAPASQGSWGGPGSAVVGGESVVGEGMFGSLAWTGGGTGRGRRKGANELLGCLGMGSRRASKTKSSSSGVMYNDDGSPRNSRTEMRDRWMHLEGEGEGTGEGLAAECDADQIQRAEGGLVGGLKPFRDRYLAGALGRMTGPVLQMFPEMEGYTAAVPSKRDMLALIKAIQSELGMAAAEGDGQGGLLRAVCKEAVKAVQLMVNKVEGMILRSPDAHKIVVTVPGTPIPVGTVTRTNPQEHNAQLLSLLVQLRDALEKSPTQILLKNADSAESSLGNQEEDEEVLLNVLVKALSGAIDCIDLVISKQLLAPLVAGIVTHLKGVLLPLLKESFSTAPTRTHVHDESPYGVDSFSPVQALLKVLPEIMKVHMLSLTSCPPVTCAVEELGLRILHLYVTVAALIRPVSENTRLRTARDMGALESALSAAGIPLGGCETSPVMQEFKAFRRLLFIDDAAEESSSSSSSKVVTDGKNNTPPSRIKLQSLPFIKDLRPSVLLGYLSSCGPTQLPSPYLSVSGAVGEADPGSLLSIYVDALTALKVDQGTQKGSPFPSVTVLYINKTGANRPGAEREWGEIAGEIRAWEAVQGSLDVYVQRISVADAQQKAHMRAWYESLQEIGGLYYGNNFTMQ